MSVRVLLAVVFTVALLAAVAPAVEDAQNARTSAAATRAADAVADSATKLVEDSEPPPPGLPGPRRVVALELPPTSALVLSNDSHVLRTTDDTRTVETTLLPAPVRVRTGELLVTGRVTLRLSYERRASGPVIVVTRGFIRESEAKKGYALTPGDASTRTRRFSVRDPVPMPP